MNDETMDEIAADPTVVVNLRNYAGERQAERAAAKGITGLLEWIILGEVR